MKKIVFLLLALIMMGTAQESMAQQRKTAAKKTAVKKTTTAKKKPVAKPAMMSIAMEGPATVDGKYAYLGIPVTETVAGMIAKLKEKGMTVKRSYDGDMNDVHGVVDGVKVRVDVQNVASGGCVIRQYDEKSLVLSKAKVRYNTLLNKVISIYGNGKYVLNEDGFKHYVINVDGAEIHVELFNEDELEGASDFYLVALCISNV